jgi:hypothetical protein
MYTISIDAPSGEFHTVVDPSAATPVENLPSDTVAALLAKESTANKGQANGYAPLDASSKVPVTNIPAEALIGGSTSIPRTTTQYVVAIPGDTAEESGENLITALNAARDLNPAVDNIVTVYLLASEYDLGFITDVDERSDCILADTAYMRFVGIGNPIVKGYCNVATSAVIHQTADNITFDGIIFDVSSDWVGANDDTNPAIWSPKVVVPNSIFRGCRFIKTGSIADVPYGVTVQPTIENCVFGNNFGGDGTFDGILSGVNVFGNGFYTGGTFSGTIKDRSFFGTDMLNGGTVSAGAVMRDVLGSSWNPSSVSATASIERCIFDDTLYVGDGAVNVFVPTSSKGQANGVAPLDENTKIPASYLPAIALSEIFEAADETAHLALDTQPGDID